jgi:Icc protein
MKTSSFNTLSDKPLIFAQISDSHLFAELDGLHHGHNVFANLTSVLTNISVNKDISFIVFTGDLTQDHSEQSYQRFVDCVRNCNIKQPIYYLAGNHDETTLLEKYFSSFPFNSNKTITLGAWQLQLIDSKSDTPAGYVSKASLSVLSKAIDPKKYQLLMMHHNPIDVGYFIDQHGLKNQQDFWDTVNQYSNIRVIACGHVHRAMELTQPLKFFSKGTEHSAINPKQQSTFLPITLYTCPATSIQFDPDIDGVAALPQGPGYRLFNLFDSGKLTSKVIYP